VSNKLKLAVAGVGNNILALCQGIKFYETDGRNVGIKRADIGGMTPHHVEVVAAFDIDAEKIGQPLKRAIFAGKNNYPDLQQDLSEFALEVSAGIAPGGDQEGEINRVADILKSSSAEVLLYSLPTGLQKAATAYALAACRAGVAFVNCTPEIVARSDEIMQQFVAQETPLIGDDLASHIGTSIIHRELLGLLNERGITLDSSYQLNLGGNADFMNLREHGGTKQQSKMNALAQEGVDVSNVEVIPSAGFIPHLRDNKVAYLNIEGSGWAGTPISIDLKLKVQDSSNAAGVIIDLIRIGAAARRKAMHGFIPAAARLLKSPPGGHPLYADADIDASFADLR